jgi:hypothetical protein
MRVQKEWDFFCPMCFAMDLLPVAKNATCSLGFAANLG